MSETTPTPWEANDEVTPEGIWIYAWQGPLKVSPAIATGKADAALIVRAVNAHKAMKESIVNLMRLVESHTGADDATANAAIEQAAAALRLAEGEASDT